MDSKIRENLQEKLEDYILETLIYIPILKDFNKKEPEWANQMRNELKKMRDINDKVEELSKTWIDFKADSKKEALKKELEQILKANLKGLEKHQPFLDSIEKLAVTSLFVFNDERFLPKGVSASKVRSVISAARNACPLLVHFKRDAGAFFLPNLRNVRAMALQLETYIQFTNDLRKRMNDNIEELSSRDFVLWNLNKPFLKSMLTMDQNSMKIMYRHLNNLNKIRMDESFRVTYLFSKNAQNFIDVFDQRRSTRMFQLLSDLEKEAVQLDRMEKGSEISSVAGSSVSIMGGILSIVGIALAPVTAGASLGFTLTGLGLGVTSGVNSIVTGITEMAVNSHHINNANKDFVEFMDDVQKIVACLDEVASNVGPIATPGQSEITVEGVKDAFRAIGVKKRIKGIVDGASAVKNLRSKEVNMKATHLGLQEARSGRKIPRLAAQLPEIKQLAKGTPLALSRAGKITSSGLNVFFIGLDAFFICKDSISLSKGSKNEAAQVIRSRVVLWRSEMEAWQKIHDHLCNGIPKHDEFMKILEQPFYPSNRDLIKLARTSQLPVLLNFNKLAWKSFLFFVIFLSFLFLFLL